MAEESKVKELLVDPIQDGWKVFADRASGDWMLLFFALIAVVFVAWMSGWTIDYMEMMVGGILGYVARGNPA
jgi:hypothetical protein